VVEAAAEGAGFEWAKEPDLEGRRGFADLVEEDGVAVRCFEEAAFCSPRSMFSRLTLLPMSG
jgi:hypothetical protein